MVGLIVSVTMMNFNVIVERTMIVGIPSSESGASMKKEVRQKFMNDYPFAVARLGFDVGNGWVPILEELCFNLSRIIPEDFHLVQVKEKFGALRIYSNIHKKEFEDLMHEAALKSEETCEICGKEGKQTSVRGWIKTLCEPHAKKCIEQDKAAWEVDLQENGE